jgi:hypothetical protein
VNVKQMAVLDALEEMIGADATAELVGEWLARNHRKPSKLKLEKPKGPARAPHYLAFVRALPCSGCLHPAPSDPHHHGPRGVGQKTDDYRTTPLCRLCHETRHSMDQLVARRLSAEEIVDCLVAYLREVERR